MYEGYLQHDAQEVLQCLLAYIQEACDTIRKEQHGGSRKEVIPESPATLVPDSSEEEEEDGQVNGKRKSDTEAGNAKKKPKSVKSNKLDADEHSKKPFTRSKRRSSREIVADAAPGEREVKDEGKEENEEVACSGEEGKGTAESATKASEGKRKKRTRLSWLRPSSKQPSIFSKFRSMGKISSIMAPKNQAEQVTDPEQAQADNGPKQEPYPQMGKTTPEHTNGNTRDQKAVENQGEMIIDE